MAHAEDVCLPVFLLLLVAGPVLLVATLATDLARSGPLGAVAAVLLVAAVLVGSVRAARRLLRWWRTTKAPDRESTGRRQVLQ